jgi:hypothetical protein
MLKQNAILSGLSAPMIGDLLENGKLIELKAPQQIYDGA